MKPNKNTNLKISHVTCAWWKFDRCFISLTIVPNPVLHRGHPLLSSLKGPPVGAEPVGCSRRKVDLTESGTTSRIWLDRVSGHEFAVSRPTQECVELNMFVMIYYNIRHVLRSAGMVPKHVL